MKKQAFTLVELIVVITILAILGTIGFLSFQGYSRDARDSVRISDLNNISRSMEYMVTKIGRLPVPDEHVNITVSGAVISYQGYAGANVLSIVGVNNGGNDPKDDSYYTYVTNANYNRYQLLGFLENGDFVSKNNFGIVKADLGERFPKTFGSSLGVILDSTNNLPVQNSGTGIDLSSETGNYTTYLSSKILTGTGGELAEMLQNQSCERIKELNQKSEDGIYIIDPQATGEKLSVYCDMSTQNGGFRIVTMLAGTAAENLFETGNSGVITDIENNITTKGNITEVWLDDEDKDIMIQCFSPELELQGYKTPLVIYDYKKNDINNLTKPIKQNTDFSSENLMLRWGSNEFILKTSYNYSTDDNTFSLSDTTENDTLIHMYSSRKFKANSIFHPNGPGYYPTGKEVNTSTQNYCITGIR